MINSYCQVAWLALSSFPDALYCVQCDVYYLFGGTVTPMFSYTARRRWFWSVAHAVSIVYLRRRAVLLAVALCVAASLIVAATATPVFRARATVRLSLPICSRCGHAQPQCDGPENE